MIDPGEVRYVIEAGEIIEDYPDDVRGHSCLMFAMVEGRPIHVVCSPKGDYLAVITAYIPDPGNWTEGWKERV